MGIYSKNLSGQKAAVFVGPANVEYTDDTTFAAFINNAVEGEIGIFLASGAVKTTALAANEEFFIAQKKDGEISKTPIIKFNEIFSKRKTAYDAPARKVMTVGYNGTANDILLDFTGASNTSPKEFGLAVRETTPGNQPFPVQEGYVTVTSATADEYTQLAKLVSQLNFDVDYEKTSPDAFVKAEILSNGTKTNLTNGAVVVNLSKRVTSTAHAQSAGALLELNDVVYKVASVIDANTIELDRPYQGASETIAIGANAASIAYTSGTTLLGVRLTGLRDEVHFVVTPTGVIMDAPVATATAWKQGSGSGLSIVDLEKEGVIFSGVGSTVNAAFAADYGQPKLFASSSVTYDQYFIDVQTVLKPSAAAPLSENRSIERIHIAVPSSGTTPSNELTTILGV